MLKINRSIHVLAAIVCLLMQMPLARCAGKSGRIQQKPKVVAWNYDPRYQPVTLAELKQIVRSPRTTTKIHGVLISRAWVSHLAEYLTEEYDLKRKAQPQNVVLQSAFGVAAIAENQPGYIPSNQALYKKHQSRDYLESAAKALENAVEGKGTHIAFCWANLGYMKVVPVSLRPLQFKEGLDSLEKAVALDPTNEAYLNTLAWAYLVVNKTYSPNRSLSLSRRAIELTSTSSKAYRNAAGALFDLRHYKQAYAMLQKSQSLIPPSERTHVSKGLLELYRKKAMEQK